MLCNVCQQETTDPRHDHPHDFVGSMEDFHEGRPCLACQKQHDSQLFTAISKGKEAAKQLGFDWDELMLQGRRCPKCQSLMIHTRLGGYRCNRGCQ